MDLYLAILGLTLTSLASGTAMCKYPQDSSITDLTAQKLLVGTELTYNCDLGHSTAIENIVTYKCVNSDGVNKWISEDCHCRKFDDNTINTDLGIDFSDCEVSTNVNEIIPKDYCGPPPTATNAKLNLSASIFPVGQEFYYSILCDVHDQNRTHGVLKCQDSSVTWNKLSDGCINKSNGPQQDNNGSHGKSNVSHHDNNGSHGKCNGSHEAEVTKYTGVHAHCVGVAVGVIIAIMMIFGIFKIAQWRMKSTGKGKFLQRNNTSTQKEEEINTAHVPLNEKL